MRHKFTLIALSCTLLSNLSFSQSVLNSVTGSGAGQNFGRSIDRYIDLDGDGKPELLVGSPNPNGIGSVSVVSSKYLSTGIGAKVLWSVQGPASGNWFGYAVAALGDVNGDGFADFAVTAPHPNGAIASSISIVSGASHAILTTKSITTTSNNIWGTSLALSSDFDGDGIADLLIGEPLLKGIPPFTMDASGYEIVSAAKMVAGSPNWVIASEVNSSGFDAEGTSISSADLDGDGIKDIIVGAPGNEEVRIYRGASPHLLWRSVATSIFSGEGLGKSVDATRDVTNDGVIDIVVGGPTAGAGGNQRGEVIVYSGALLAANTPPFDVRHWYGTSDNEHFGSSVAATPDVNGDFVGDVVVGSPDWSSIFAISAGRVTLFSGATGEILGTLAGQPGDQLGSSVSKAWDYGPIFGFEIAAGGALSSVNGSASGVLRVVTMFPTLAASYCTAKTNSLGCTPAISSSGSASKTSLSSFLIKATNLINNKPGLLLYGLNAAASPFQGGTLCVGSPIKRVGAQSTGGNPPPNDCSGMASFDFNVQIRSGVDVALIQGRQVFAQYWSRDPGSTGGSSLTNALRFVINP